MDKDEKIKEAMLDTLERLEFVSGLWRTMEQMAKNAFKDYGTPDQIYMNPQVYEEFKKKMKKK